MFYYIEGVVSLIDGSVAVVDCGGVGYAVNTIPFRNSRVADTFDDVARFGGVCSQLVIIQPQTVV